MPDFVKLADAYGWQGRRITKPEEVQAAIADMLASDGPYLLDVKISPEQNVYPMVAPGSALDDVMGAIDVAVGAVRTDMPKAAQAQKAEPESPCATIDAQFGGRWEATPDEADERMSAEEFNADRAQITGAEGKEGKR